MSGSPFVAMGNQWSATAEFDLNSQQQQNANQWLRGSGTQIRFTPRVSMAAAAYPAGATFQEEGVTQVSPMRSDLEHGVGLYEYICASHQARRPSRAASSTASPDRI